MVIIQGTLLDRIDMNIQDAVVNVAEGKEHLKKVMVLDKLGSIAPEESMCVRLYNSDDRDSVDPIYCTGSKICQKVIIYVFWVYFSIIHHLGSWGFSDTFASYALPYCLVYYFLFYWSFFALS